MRALVVLAMVVGWSGAALAKGAPNNGCADPIVGLWSARYHTSGMEDWHDFQLSIERVPDAPDKLTGLITVEVWNGDKTQSSPPGCPGGEGPNHYIVEMRALGTFDGKSFTFDGQDLVVRERKCGGPPAYAIDHLFGTLEGAEKGERWLELGNNDGTRRLTRAIQFKRVRCAVVRIVE